MSDPGQKLWLAAANGETEDVRRLLAEKAPLEYDGVRHRPYRKAQPTARHTRALSVAKGAAERA